MLSKCLAFETILMNRLTSAQKYSMHIEKSTLCKSVCADDHILTHGIYLTYCIRPNLLALKLVFGIPCISTRYRFPQNRKSKMNIHICISLSLALKLSIIASQVFFWKKNIDLSMDVSTRICP